MIRVILIGALGRMGRMVAAEIEANEKMDLVGAVESLSHPGLGTIFHGVSVVSDLQGIIDGADIVVDFSSPDGAMTHIAECAASGKAFISGTTGLAPGQIEAAREVAGKIPVLLSPNMSAGVNLMFRLAGEVAGALPDFDVEIVEIHHNRKKDSPSGTAVRLADSVREARPEAECVYGREGFVGERDKNEIGMHSLRGGDVTGEHKVIFAGEGERFELVHRAHSRRTFARGTIRAIAFMSGREPGFYTMADILGF